MSDSISVRQGTVFLIVSFSSKSVAILLFILESSKKRDRPLARLSDFLFLHSNPAPRAISCLRNRSCVFSRSILIVIDFIVNCDSNSLYQGSMFFFFWNFFVSSVLLKRHLFHAVLHYIIHGLCFMANAVLHPIL